MLRIVCFRSVVCFNFFSNVFHFHFLPLFNLRFNYSFSYSMVLISFLPQSLFNSSLVLTLCVSLLFCGFSIIFTVYLLIFKSIASCCVNLNSLFFLFKCALDFFLYITLFYFKGNLLNFFFSCYQSVFVV